VDKVFERVREAIERVTGRKSRTGGI
jgi:hypothetical protein